MTAAALLVHVAALGEIAWTWPRSTSRPQPQAMQVRMLAASPSTVETGDAGGFKPSARSTRAPVRSLPLSVPVLVPVLVPVSTEALTPVVRVSGLLRSDVRALPPADAADVVEPTPARPDRALAPDALVAASPTPGADALPAEAASADEPIPHYRTRMPEPITLRYDLQRGMLHGSGELTWLPQAGQYELKLEGKVAGLSVLTQTSTGAFDAEGLAPQRFVDQRFRRPTAAANFQRASGKITFSGPSTEYPLRPGSQDRLSWMVQLAAIVSAEPRLRAPGSKIAMNVVSAQGDAGVWVFRCLGPETIDVGAASVEAIKFVREPREAYDTSVQVWLDPQRFDLPVRARQQSGSNDEAFELRLLEVVMPR